MQKSKLLQKDHNFFCAAVFPLPPFTSGEEKSQEAEHLPHLFNNDDQWIFVLRQKVENAPDFESIIVWDVQPLSVKIFHVTQRPAHPVELHEIKIFLHLWMKEAASSQSQACQQRVYKCKAGDWCLAPLKPQVFRMWGANVMFLKGLIFIQVRAH